MAREVVPQHEKVTCDCCGRPYQSDLDFAAAAKMRLVRHEGFLGEARDEMDLCWDCWRRVKEAIDRVRSSRRQVCDALKVHEEKESTIDDVAPVSTPASEDYAELARRCEELRRQDREANGPYHRSMMAAFDPLTILLTETEEKKP